MKNIIWTFKTFGFINGVRFTLDYIKLSVRRFFSSNHKKLMMEHYDVDFDDNVQKYLNDQDPVDDVGNKTITVHSYNKTLN